MLKRIGMLMMSVMLAAAVFSGCGAGAEGTAAVVSETGLRAAGRNISFGQNTYLSIYRRNTRWQRGCRRRETKCRQLHRIFLYR